MTDRSEIVTNTARTDENDVTTVTDSGNDVTITENNVTNVTDHEGRDDEVH